MYVVIEGIDTSGKSTQIEKLKASLKNVVATKEPGGTKLGEKIRSLLLEGDLNLSTNAELFLFLSDRAEHYEKVVKPNRKNSIVLSDRSFLSGLAYAMTNHKNSDLDFLMQMNRFSISNDMPDLIIFLKTNETLLKKRVGEKENDIIEQRGIKYLLDVQNKMESILKDLGIKHLILDASLSIEDLHSQIKGFIND